MESLFSPGKLLLTSEYVVLDGALALAVPTRLGQELAHKQVTDSQCFVYWEAYHQNRLWLKCKIDYKSWRVLESNDPQASDFVLKVLITIQELSSSVLQSTHSYHLKTNLQFPSDYGWGSSSTLMNNLALWAGVDPYLLNDQTLGGSGYDIAVAREQKALLFQIQESQRLITPQAVDFSFKDDLIFIHLNRKQDSREGIRLYRNKSISANLVADFTDITKKVLKSGTLEEFSYLMKFHESLLSAHLGLDTAHHLYFSDCPSFIKSLGAWGGDFVMSHKFPGYEAYFQDKGFSIIFQWSDIIN